MAKLNNVKAVNELLQGTHKTQTRKTFGVSDAAAAAEKNKKREIGETWEEYNVHTDTTYIWEQHDGYRSKRVKNLGEIVDEIRTFTRSFPNCQKETCTCTAPNRLDEVFRKKIGMCADCNFSMETKLKIQGKFNEYALNKMKSNADSFFVQSDKEVEILKAAIKAPVDFLENGDGGIEKWSGGNAEAVIQQIDEQYSDFKNKVYQKFGQGDNV
jgi:hypothetical protein